MKKNKAVIDLWLPTILEGYCKGSDKDRDESEKEAEQYLKILEDSASYSFGYNHSISYSMLGYLCGYLRYHYPEEFICSFLNCANNEDDINNGTNLAKIKGIRIVEPKFRYSKSDYFFNKENHIIYKGMSSIKFMNAKCSNDLYELRDNDYKSFIDLLYDISKTSINSRQLEILIKLDFFSEFGNSKELMSIYNMFDFFKSGNAKTISKEKIDFNNVLQNIVSRNSNESEKQYTKLNTKNILYEINEYIKSQKRDDYSYKEKISFQLEYLGYINICTNSNSEEERRKLIITDIIPMKSKKGKNAGEIWCYVILTQSIGSGKNGRFTLMKDVYDSNKINKMDIIFAEYVYKKGEYWYLGKYKKIGD